MKNYVILLAGGVGKRMQADVPKQFIEVEDKPIVAYTMKFSKRIDRLRK